MLNVAQVAAKSLYVEREVLGNKLADMSADIAELCLAADVFFSIENPAGRYLLE